MNKRQPFITPSYYTNLRTLYDSSEAYWSDRVIDEDAPLQGESLRACEIKQDTFEGLIIRYTAGEPLDRLINPLEKLIGSYEHYQKTLGAYEGEKDISPLNIDELPAHFEECVQVMSLCILLQRTDLLARFVKLTDNAGFYAQDTLYEDLLKKSLPGRADIDEWYHGLYTPLIKAVHTPSKTEAAKLLNEYCTNWYASFENLQAPWYDSHLDIADDDGGYYGYWAFEAGAIAYLYDIDDSAITHMVYPRDLVEFARSARSAPAASATSKIYAGQICSRTGYWYSPAQPNSRQFFSQGETMPEFKNSSWGATIWYWSGDEE